MNKAFLMASVLAYMTSGFCSMSLPSYSSTPMENSRVVIDATLAPAAEALRAGASARPLSRIQFPNGLFFDVVNNEVSIKTDDLNTLQGFLDRWNGKIRAKYTAKPNQTLYIIQIDSRNADVENLPEYLQALGMAETDKIRVSDPQSKRLISMMAREANLRGLPVGFSMDLIVTDSNNKLLLFSLQSIFDRIKIIDRRGYYHLDDRAYFKDQ